MKVYFRLAIVLLTGSVSLSLSAAQLYFVDAHSQLDHGVDDPGIILKHMEATGVHKTLLAARGKRAHSDIAEMAATYPERIVGMVRTKGGAYQKNSAEFYKKLRKRVKSGHYEGMAEILIYHAQKGNKADEVDVPLTDPRVDAVLQACLEQGWPMYLHIEFASLHGNKRTQTMQDLDKFIDAESMHPFVLTHMGQLDIPEVKSLLERHANLYFMVAHTNPVITDESNQPWTKMFSGENLKEEWKQVMIQYPDRFIFAMDNVWPRHWQDFYLRQMALWHSALAELPGEVAHKFAHANAERLWHLQPKQ